MTTPVTAAVAAPGADPRPSGAAAPEAAFLWGAATASYQIEGAVREDGRGPSIWDVFCERPGAVERGESGEVACDHYHRSAEDVRLLRELGVQAYRFSIAWPRVLPTGRGRQNPAGLDFYDRLVDQLLAARVRPFATLFHWDLPQALQEKGGWANRDLARWFTDYALTVTEHLGDRVSDWIVLNEPSVFAWAGHATGTHAPGIADKATFLAVTHHLNLAQGLALQALRSARPAWRLGTSLNLQRGVPADPTPAAAEAARRHEAYWVGSFFGPLLAGRYPEAVQAELAPWVQSDDLRTIRQRLDFLGINHYTRSYLRPNPAAVLGYDHVNPPAGVPLTGMGWEINPREFTDALCWVRAEYAGDGPPIYVTENGAFFPDEVAPDGRRVPDPHRTEFLERAVGAVGEARRRGVDVRGYFVWSLLDNFEWAVGYRARFGIVHVDYATQQRRPKDSYYWYRDLIARGHAP